MEQLNLIYRVARMANVSAETHEAVARATQELAKILEEQKNERVAKKEVKKEVKK